MILSHSHKFIFLCNGKTGTSSIEAALDRYQEGSEFETAVDGLYTPKHIPPLVLRGLLGPSLWEEYFVFMFVRNPWDWFVSQYFWNHEPAPISKKRLLHSPIEAVQSYKRKKDKRTRLRSLEAFTKADIKDTYDLLRQYRGIYEADSLFQYNYAYSPEGQKLVDFIGRFEQISQDFEQVMEHLDLDAELPHRNSTSHRDYRSYYTPETATLIEDLYSIDIETFGYSFKDSN
ncbi:sulfotransferase family protein [Salinibacter ruber]|uniref:sulfotransferase family protein n=1 Tax=Salinibacter ruber TaxID=146919 RepID=UPI00216A6550|nr:sulfotransferase family protein [Salinibacter ruber]MCS3685481.1 hypothetical protein [Salinibacter ruber]